VGHQIPPQVASGDADPWKGKKGGKKERGAQRLVEWAYLFIVNTQTLAEKADGKVNFTTF